MFNVAGTFAAETMITAGVDDQRNSFLIIFFPSVWVSHLVAASCGAGSFHSAGDHDSAIGRVVRGGIFTMFRGFADRRNSLLLLGWGGNVVEPEDERLPWA